MRRRNACVIVFGFALSVTGLGASAMASAVDAGANLLEPPQQRMPWPRPATQLPASLLDSVELLFAQGVADPRGGTYRKIEVVVGTCWSGYGGVVKTRGWVLPAVPGRTQTFAVCWNGLVYPTASVGDAADLNADVTAAAAVRPPDFAPATPETTAVAFDSPLPLKVALLLRLGEVQAAESLWPTVRDVVQKDPNDQAQPDDPYLALAREWGWYAFDAATCAHKWGNDVFSRETAQRLADAVQMIEKTASEKGFKPPLQVANDRGAAPYVGFVGQLSTLLEDQKRRVADGAVTRVLEHPAKYPDKSARIAALVRDLEVVAARQSGQPGGVSPDDDATVRAIEREGADAIEPLFRCMETDQRLTRSVSFHRDFFASRTLIPVKSAAYVALRNILQTRTFGPASDEWNRGGQSDAKAVAAEIRAFVRETPGKSAAERWFDTLADDAAGPTRWLEAANAIVEAIDVENRGGWVSVPNRKPGDVPALKGESLRDRRNPSVADLVTKRVPLVAAERDGWLFSQHQATAMALALHAWDRTAAVPVLREQMLRCMRASDVDRKDIRPEPNWSPSTQTTQLMARCVGQLAAALADAGDVEGKKAYADWVVTQTPGMAGGNVSELLEPIWQHPNDPTLAAAAETLFNGTDSPWRCLPTARGFREGRESSVATLSHYELPAWRRHVLRNLDDTTPIGTAELKDGQFIVRFDGGGQWSSGILNPNDPLLPKPGDPPMTVRVCDSYASKLALLRDRPKCELYWPLADRDRARAALAEHLRRWAEPKPSP